MTLLDRVLAGEPLLIAIYAFTFPPMWLVGEAVGGRVGAVLLGFIAVVFTSYLTLLLLDIEERSRRARPTTEER